ncbi:MAG: hypothetical protein JRJ39_14910 [Deltaproteobacteria bacterium]|nr:hypothetical protein [Deltaproteobacteria bacterium]
MLPSTMAIFTHSIDLSEIDIPVGTKFAIIISEKTKSDFDFIKTVAQSRGVIMKNFESRDEALTWLTE